MNRSQSWITLGATALIGFLSIAGCPILGGSTVGGQSTTFNLDPTVIITTDLVRGVAPLPVQFSSSRSSDDGLIVSRLWDFGDGSTSQEISPRHIFQSTGTFTVRLTLTDDLGATASKTVVVSVTEAPLPVIVTDRTSADAPPATISFDGSQSSDPDGTIVQYQWDFGDGSREFAESIQHQYATSGTFRAVLTVTDNTGVTAEAEVLIQIGIVQPTIEIRTPPPSVANMVVPIGSPLWLQGVYTVDRAATFTRKAGLDGDKDICDAQLDLVKIASATIDQRLTGHGDRVTDAAFSNDGQFVISSSEDGSLRLHNAATGALLSTFAAPAGVDVTSVAFSPDGTRFAYGQTNGSVVLRIRADGTIVRTFSGHTGFVNDVAFSNDGSQILSAGSDRHALLWNVADGTILRDFTHALSVNAVAFNPADPTMVATAGADNVTKLWNITSGGLLLTLTGHAEPVNDVVFSPDGFALFTASDDNTARSWSPFSGALVTNFIGHTNNVNCVAITPDKGTLITGGTDGVVRFWNSVSGEQVRNVAPCISPIAGLSIKSDGVTVAVAVGARNDIQLDTNPSGGNDINLTQPVSLQLENVPSLGGGTVPVGDYYVWAEIATDRSAPARSYGNTLINVIPQSTNAVTADTPVVPLLNDEAHIVAGPFVRQVFDIGPMLRGDRLFLSFLSQPGFGDIYQPPTDFSLAILDADQKIFAWYQDGILFNQDARLVIGHNSSRYYVVTDGGYGVHVRIQRQFGFDTREQRVLVRFNGSGNSVLSIGNSVNTIVPALSANAINGAWGANETLQLKNAIMTNLRNKYAGFNVVFYSSDDVVQPLPPFQTMFVGGSATFLYGIADYIDPRNETVTGTGITFATSIGLDALAGVFTNPAATVADVGAAIANVAAHETGHLLGLRHTQGDPFDIMNAQSDPTLPLIFTVAPVTDGEQVYGLTSIGIQDAPQILLETVGPD